MNVKGLTYVKGSFSHNIARMMMCTHADTRYDSHNTICNDCGILLNTDIMTAAINNALDAESRRIATEILDSRRAYTICNHTSKDTDDSGIPFCAGCGLMFEDETVYVNEQRDPDHCPDHYLPRKQAKTRAKTKAKTKGNTKGVIPKPKGQDLEVAETEPKPKEPEITPRSVKDLITIAKSRGIKGAKNKSGKELCEILGLEIDRPDKLVFRNKDTGEEHRFKTIYRASKEMDVNPGSIQHHITSGKVITSGGTEYNIYEVQTDAK